ncbi:glycosyltransferase family 2 protein [Shewanella baltica]|uniref:glycosyltransferase family 2 protein n=1 Tax=Shewanella TaxID=22 RepID=UPI003D7B19EF
MKFSLILATYGRTEDLYRLFDSLLTQTFKNFEVIVIDQNGNDIVGSIISKYSSELDIKLIESRKGLSIARNLGIRNATGDIFCFPDDDCWFPPELLSSVCHFLKQNSNLNGISIRCLDEDCNDSMGKWRMKSEIIDKKNIWTSAVSIGVFLKNDYVLANHFFNEDLGVGAPSIWQSGEETDYLLNLILKFNYNILYYPDLYIHHPSKNDPELMLKRAYPYGCGMGYVLKLHDYDIVTVLKFLIRPIIASVFFVFNRKKSTFYFKNFKGRVRGYFES